MKTSFIFIISSVIYSQFLPVNQLFYLESKLDIKEEQSISLKYPISSFFIPGLGQYQIYKETLEPRHKARALIFFGVEMISAGIHYNYRSRHNNQKNSYKTFADSYWDFSNWISSYNDFHGTEYENIWTDPDGVYTQIGESSHFVQFYFDGELKRTTDTDFLNLYQMMIDEIDAGLDIYSQHSISIVKDQHFYENIGKYNEFFSGWDDADIDNIIVQTTGLNYTIALSPRKNSYINSYEKSENYSDIAESVLNTLYFNHFISMLDAFVLARKFGGRVMLDSATIYDKKRPAGVELKLSIKL